MFIDLLPWIQQPPKRIQNFCTFVPTCKQVPNAHEHEEYASIFTRLWIYENEEGGFWAINSRNDRHRFDRKAAIGVHAAAASAAFLCELPDG